MGFVLDTNVYIAADRDRVQADALTDFYETHLPQTHLHAVVVQKMLAGAITPLRAQQLHTALIAPFERRGRIVVPDYGTWKRAGEILARLVREGLVAPGAFRHSLIHDVMLAASCRQFGHTLVTANTRDFEKIRKVEQFDFVTPFPD